MSTCTPPGAAAKTLPAASNSRPSGTPAGLIRGEGAPLPERERADVAAAPGRLGEKCVGDTGRLRERLHEPLEAALAQLGFDALAQRCEQAVAEATLRGAHGHPL